MPFEITPQATQYPEIGDNNTPYEGLTPDVVLDALAEVGCFGDGRLIQLNSYENRVFQVFLEDKSVVVAKFYRPQRWSDAQILEEHAYAQELQTSDIPVIAPLALTRSVRAVNTTTVSCAGVDRPLHWTHARHRPKATIPATPLTQRG